MERIKLAIIDNSINSEIYNPLIHWKNYLNVEWTSFKARESQFPRFKDGYIHFLLTGSEASILERESWVYEEIEVVNLQQPFLILASSKHCQIQAFQWQGKPIWGIQIHPEMEVASAKKLLRTLIDQYLKNKSLFQKALSSTPRDSRLVYPIVETFLNKKRND